MTTIVAVAEDGEVWMGADSAVFDGNIYGLTEDKVFIVAGMLLGFAGDIRLAQVVKYRMKWPKKDTTDDAIRWLVVDVVDALRRAHKDAGPVDEERDVDLLVGLDGKIYEIEAGYAVVEIDKGWQAIGSGQDFAYGSLYATDEAGYTPEERIQLALEASAEFDPYTSPPFKILKL